MKLVGVTSAATGPAHLDLAAVALEGAATAAGHEIRFETQAAAGFTPLDPAVIAAADGVILAVDVEVRDRSRFAGKPTLEVGVKEAINQPDQVIAQVGALVDTVGGLGRVSAGQVPAAGSGISTRAVAGRFGIRLRGYLMTGVSYMIPFVAVGGILLALSFMLGGYQIVFIAADDSARAEFLNHFNFLSVHDWAGLFLILAWVAFGLVNAVLAGFVAYAIADRPGLVPGFVGGMAVDSLGGGFLGAIVGGLVGGFIAKWFAQIRVPRAIRGVMPVVIIPVVATLLNAVLILTVIGNPLSRVQFALTDWLDGLSGVNLALLGVILGLMMAFDMGGPVNKSAYVFAVLNLTTAIQENDGRTLQIMACVMAAGMVPPLAMALSSTILGPELYTEAEQQAGKAAWLLGASFITEGAIPFAASDPLRVIPSIMAGSGLTGALVMAFGCELRAPHGGIWVLGLISKPVMYLIAIGFGTVLAGYMVTALKARSRVSDGEIEKSLTHAAIG